MHTAQVTKAVELAFREAGDNPDNVFSYLIPSDVAMSDARIVGHDVYVFFTMNDGSRKVYKILIQLEEHNVQPVSDPPVQSR